MMNRVPLRAVLALLAVAFFPLPVRSQVSFLQPSNADAASGPTIFVADFNNDGKLDLLSSSGVLDLGKGDGTFASGTNVLGSTSPPVLAVADFNGDLKPDLIEEDTGKGALLVQFGNGDGTFQAPISTAIGTILSTAVAVDLNGDDKADVVGISGGSLLVYVGNGDGTFKSAVSYNLGTTSGVLVLSLGDFNSDQKTDIAVSVAGQEIVFIGNGDGTFQSNPITSTGVSAPSFAAVGDFNGDGKLDLAIMCGLNCNPQSGVSLILGNGDGTFQAPTTLFSLDYRSVIAAADLNGDGRLDLVVEQDPTVLQIYLQRTDGTFSNANSYVMTMVSGVPYTGIAIGDFDHDGKPDIAAENGILLGNGDGTFQGIQLSIVPYPSAAVAGDFEKNGRMDVAEVSPGTPAATLAILQNDGQGNLAVLHSYALDSSYPQDVAVADFNADGNPDLVVLGMDNSSDYWYYEVFLGNGDGSFQAPIYGAGGFEGGVFRLIVADFNNDHKPDIAFIFAANGADSAVILLGNGDGTFSPPTYNVISQGENLQTFAVADFNGDGDLDIAAGTIETGTGILYGNGDGTFQSMTFPSSLNGFGTSFAADVNNDGKADLIGGQQIALGNGSGTFKIQPSLQNYVAGIADFNGDGKLDIVVTSNPQSNSPTTGIQLGNGDGTFGPLIQVPTNGSLPLSGDVFYADINGDGRTDVVFPWSLGLGVLLNTTPASFELWTGALSPSPLIAGGSAASTVSAVANFGFNTAATLSCTGLPTGAVCAFNPPSIAGSSGKSILTITTTASTTAGTYPVQIIGSAGAATSSTTLSVVIQAASDFSFGPSSGSPTSETITAGQSANFSLDLTPSGAFTGTVKFSCLIIPTVTNGPTCNVPSSVQISGSSSQSISVSVGTTAPGSTSLLPNFRIPPTGLQLLWICALLGTGVLFAPTRKRISVLALSIAAVGLISLPACGGSGSPVHGTGRTPAGTYTVTVTATSGSLNHNTVLQVVVH